MFLLKKRKSHVTSFFSQHFIFKQKYFSSITIDSCLFFFFFLVGLAIKVERRFVAEFSLEMLWNQGEVKTAVCTSKLLGQLIKVIGMIRSSGVKGV